VSDGYSTSYNRDPKGNDTIEYLNNPDNVAVNNALGIITGQQQQQAPSQEYTGSPIFNANDNYGEVQNRLPQVQGQNVNGVRALGSVNIGRGGQEKVDTKPALQRMANRKLGDYEWNRVQKTPQQRETERLARIRDAMNNRYVRTMGGQMAMQGPGGQTVNLGPAKEGGVKRAQQFETEDTRMQEKMRDLEARRAEWNSGLGQEGTKFGNQAELFKNAQAAMNNLATQFDALDLRQNLMNADIDKKSVEQLVTGYNEIQLQARQWLSGVAQAMKKFGKNLDLQEALAQAQVISDAMDDWRMAYFYISKWGSWPGVFETGMGEAAAKTRERPKIKPPPGSQNPTASEDK
jgi:hypothetical protein